MLPARLRADLIFERRVQLADHDFFRHYHLFLMNNEQ
jgi:hypothetical protein